MSTQSADIVAQKDMAQAVFTVQQNITSIVTAWNDANGVVRLLTVLAVSTTRMVIAATDMVRVAESAYGAVQAVLDKAAYIARPKCMKSKHTCCN